MWNTSIIHLRNGTKDAVGNISSTNQNEFPVSRVEYIIEADYLENADKTVQNPENLWNYPRNAAFASGIFNTTSLGNISNNFDTFNTENSTDEKNPELNWGVLSLTSLIVATAVGNILVCLAVCWEKRLQNMTNYFLMSLAIADLLVSLLVMPLGMVVELYGKFHLRFSH